MSSIERVVEADVRLRIARKICEQALGSDEFGKGKYEEVVFGEISVSEYFDALKRRVDDPKLHELIAHVEASGAP